jgi:hypothetical protein
MPRVTQTRCPRCNGALPLIKLWWQTNNMYMYVLPAKELGVVCPTCGTALVVLMGGVICASFLSFWSAVGLGLLWLIWAPRILSGHVALAAALLMLILFSVLLQPRFAMLFAGLRPVIEGETPDYPLGKPESPVRR